VHVGVDVVNIMAAYAGIWLRLYRRA